MKVEAKVGLLFIAGVVMAALFAYMLGALDLFSRAPRIQVMYNFAGGIEVGSPVRVMGVKVGKVESVEFAPGFRMPDTGEEVQLRVEISVAQRSWETLREDSEFYVNLAGVIGEKFLEITPGSSERRALQPGDIVRGIDPPRIDQFISQGYGLAERVLDFVKKNEGSVENMIGQLDGLLSNFNKTLTLLDKTTQNPDMARLLSNTLQISDDVAFFTRSLRSDDSLKTFGLMNDLVWRLEDLDKDVIREFLQKEGIRARLF